MESNRLLIADDKWVVLPFDSIDIILKKNKKPAFLEWSVAPSILNIKAQGLAHYFHWMKLSLSFWS